MKRTNRILVCVLALLMCLCSACSQPGTAPAPDQTGTPQEDPVDSGLYTPGSYTAQAQGFGGPVEATVTLDENSIVSVDVVGSGETAGIGSNAVDQLPAAIVAAQGIAVDGISGATATSNAIFAAVADALSQAGAEPDVQQVAQSYKAGTYTGSSKGHNGPIEVNVAFSDSEILSVEVVSNSDTPSLVNTATKIICPAIVENQSLAVDAVSTATFSSRGILRAVESCVSQAGGNVEALKRVVIPAAAPAANEEMTADIVVVGGGTSGSLATLTAAREGLNVICIESAPMVGGAGEIAGFMSMQWFGSTLQQTSDELEPLDLEQHIQDKISAFSEIVNYRADALIYKHYFEDCGPMVDMLSDVGMELNAPTNIGIKIPPKGTRWQLLHDEAAKLGAKTLLETRGEQLLVDEAGAITGVVASRADGSTLTIHAGCVILCTGGASSNMEMMMQYFPDYTEYAENCGIATTDGKGLEMAWDIGAAKGSFGVHAHNHTLPLIAKYAGIDTVTATDDIAIVGNVPLLWLNRDGSRFSNEELCWKPTPGGNAIYMAKRAFVVLDQATVDGFIENGTPIKPWRGAKDKPLPDLQKQLDEGTSVGYVFKANSIDELSALTGWNAETAAKQIARYNGFVADGVDADYGKTAESLLYSVENGPFYAIEIRPRVLGSFGGINVDGDYKVLNDDGHPIDGLYAAGDMAAGWFGPVYPNLGGLTSGFNTTSGYSAVMCAKEFIAK